MKATELIIGDWVYCSFSDKPCLIVGIEEYPSKYCMVKVDKVVGAKDIISLTPILLTKEILEKNGFTKDTGGEECWGCEIGWLIPHEYDDRFEVKSWETEILGEQISFGGVINYVHQLQNALKICEIDKEIVL